MKPLSAELALDFTAAAQRWGVVAALLGALAVALGAFGAHLLPNYLAGLGLEPAEQLKRLNNWETAARYQMYHALALLAVAWLVSRPAPSLAATIAGVCFVLGVLIFSGCLYALVLSGVKVLGAIVPIGGLLMIAGWIVLGLAFLLKRTA